MNIKIKPNMSVLDLLNQLNGDYSVLTLSGNFAGPKRKLRALTETPEKLKDLDLLDSDLIAELFANTGLKLAESSGAVNRTSSVGSDNSYLNSYMRYVGIDDFNDEWAIELSEDHFEGLKDSTDILSFLITNSPESMMEQEGATHYVLIADLKNNRILPVSNSYLDGDDYQNGGDEMHETYIGTWHASIPGNYHEFNSFIGQYILQGNIAETWDVNFHGDFDGVDGEVDSELLEKIKETINGQTFYAFLVDVFANFE